MTDPEILEPQNWTFPISIAYGPGRLSEIGERCVAMGLSNPLIVTDKGSRDLPFISQLLVYLADAGLYSGIFSDISPNPRDDEIDAGCEVFRSGNHDAIIAIGGGSAMDVPEIFANPAVMVAAAPCGVMSFMLAMNYGVKVDNIARVIFISSLFSLVTISYVANI